ncbi:F0F1 ATP synthase subunit B [Phoenicibacter congonensis]|uniref:F0F1 ATP synthase subunit B n=1 Tax=Phoenicibacter congonensis TaxID=1944646 RepID=UPI0009A8F50C|nr:F0F1 ATP synthase subunit B [Phoenicibacter congonensis]
MNKTANIKTASNALKIGALASAVVLAMSVFAGLLSPTLAFANEEASSSGIGAIIPNPIEFFPMLIAFIILCIVLGKFGWPMFNGMLEKREKSIRDALEQSENAKVEAEKVLEEYKKQLESAKTESAEIVATARTNAEAIEADLKKKAEASAEEIIAKAKISIEAEKKAAIAELQSSVADMSIDVASKLIANDLSDDEHRKIIEKYIVEAGSFND